MGWTGQKIDSVWVNASWSGRLGPIRGMLQGNVMLGTARGGTVRGVGGTALPASIPLGRDYDIFAGSAIAYAEVDFGIVRPFVGFVYGSADGDPRDDELHGFQAQPLNDSTQITATGFFNHLDTSPTFALRDYACPGRAAGLVSRTQGTAGEPVCRGAAGAGQRRRSMHVASQQCSHSTSNLYNSRFGLTSHVGLVITYSNPGTLVIPVGLRVFPVKGHELTGYYVYRGMVDTNLLEIAFAPELAGRTALARRSYTASGASGNGPSIRTLTSASMGRWPFRARGTKTWRAWLTAIPMWRASRAVAATTRRCGPELASGRASRTAVVHAPWSRVRSAPRGSAEAIHCRLRFAGVVGETLPCGVKESQ